MASVQLNRFDEAEAALRLALEFDPGFAPASLILHKLRGLPEYWGALPRRWLRPSASIRR